MTEEVHLFIDDTGSRHPDHCPSEDRNDGMDCFGLGGVLINVEDIPSVMAAHRAFCEQWDIDYALHSYEIRGGRNRFKWLKNPERAVEFFRALNGFLVDLPALGIATIIHRPGYVARYSEKYGGRPWFMDKMACMILTERAAKYADSIGRKLRIYFEGSGKQEDRDLLSFVKELKVEGMPFDEKTSAPYSGLCADDFRRIVLGDPRWRTKKTPMIQIADLYLYPMAKAGYVPAFPPFVELMRAGRLIDAMLPEADRPFLGIKYSCFDG